jgi:hypothetical protein
VLGGAKHIQNRRSSSARQDSAHRCWFLFCYFTDQPGEGLSIWKGLAPRSPSAAYSSARTAERALGLPVTAEVNEAARRENNMISAAPTNETRSADSAAGQGG